MIKLHEMNTTDFTTGEVLNEAVNVTENRKINDIAALEFDYPMDSKGQIIHENMLITCNDRKYEVVRTTRKMDGRDIVHVVCEDMFSRKAKHTFIPTIPDLIGKKVSAVIEEALKTAKDFILLDTDDLLKLGMKPVGNDEFKIDFFSVDKTTFWDFLMTVIENLGRGEIYSDGYKFAIVERIGQDRGVRLSIDKNMQNIEIERDSENIVTRLYPFGSDDMTISSVNNDVSYIDSDNISIYGIHEGYKDYSDYTEPSKILANAQWEFDSDNEDRIDIPKVTITGKLIDLSKLSEYGEIYRVDLGDTVHVLDVDGVEHTERVVEGVWHPFDAQETTISIGHMRRDMFFTLYQLRQKKREIEAVQTTSKQLTTRKLSGTVNSDRNNIQSDNELLKIVGDLLTIQDKSRIRIRLGNYGGEFVFIIYDKNGKEAIYLNEDGEAVFAGKITSKKSAELYNGLILGAAADGSIKFQGPVTTEGSISVVDHEMDINANVVRINGMNVVDEIKELKALIDG